MRTVRADRIARAIVALGLLSFPALARQDLQVVHEGRELVARVTGDGSLRLQTESGQELPALPVPPGVTVDPTSLRSFGSELWLAGSSSSSQGASRDATNPEQRAALARGASKARAGEATRTNEVTRKSLFVVRWQQGQPRWLDGPPAGDPGKPQRSPTLVGRDRLVGLAWFDGSAPREHRLWYSAWQRGRFEQPIVVSDRQPGTQTSLSSGVLLDGTPVLVWTAFDGRDDEVVASRLVNGQWAEPQPISGPNNVPDVLPTTATGPRGVVVAWNRFAGDQYRLTVASLEIKRDGGLGLAAERLLDQPGLLFPAMAETSSGNVLLAKQAGEDRWWALHLDASGVPTAIARATTGSQPPVVFSSPGKMHFRVRSEDSRLGPAEPADFAPLQSLNEERPR